MRLSVAGNFVRIWRRGGIWPNLLDFSCNRCTRISAPPGVLSPLVSLLVGNNQRLGSQTHPVIHESSSHPGSESLTMSSGDDS